MFGRKQKNLEELRNAVDYWSTLYVTVIKHNEKLTNEIIELKVENATLKERLHKKPPEDQEDLTTD